MDPGPALVIAAFSSTPVSCPGLPINEPVVRTGPADARSVDLLDRACGCEGSFRRADAGPEHRAPIRHEKRTRHSSRAHMPAFDLPQCAVCAGGRSDRLVKNEYLVCHVRLGVVGAEKRNYSTTGQLLDRSAEVGFHHLPEESASLVNVVLASVLD